MRTEHALRYLLLKHLWKLRGVAGAAVHTEVARSLVVDHRDRAHTVSWTRGGRRFQLDSPAEQFTFYRRGDRLDRREPEEGGRPDNENVARTMAAEMLGIAVPVEAGDGGEARYFDTWRWPALCAAAGVIDAISSHRPAGVVLAATSLAETTIRAPWLYLPWTATLALSGYPVTGAATSLATATMTWLAGTTPRQRRWWIPYVALAALSWYLVAYRDGLSRVDWRLAVPVALPAMGAWTIAWISYDGPRLTVLLLPLVAVVTLADRDLAGGMTYLSASLIYASWLAFRTRSHAP